MKFDIKICITIYCEIISFTIVMKTIEYNPYYVYNKEYIKEVRIMKIKTIVLIGVLSIFALIGCTKSSQQSTNKAGNNLVSVEGITSLKMLNPKLEVKDVKNKSDITKILTIINGVNVTKRDIQTRDGMGYGVEITYSDGKKENLNFMGTYMFHNSNPYEVDKDISNELKNYYNKN